VSFLTLYYDPALEVGREDTRASLIAAEAERLSRQYAVMMHATTIPRRLGPDASSEELAADKKRARRAAHVFEQCYLAWTKRKTVQKQKDEALLQEGATLIWDNWWGEHQLYLNRRVVYVVTWCEKISSDARWTKTAVVRLQNEHRWLEYAMR